MGLHWQTRAMIWYAIVQVNREYQMPKCLHWGCEKILAVGLTHYRKAYHATANCHRTIEEEYWAEEGEQWGLSMTETEDSSCS